MARSADRNQLIEPETDASPGRWPEFAVLGNVALWLTLAAAMVLVLVLVSRSETGSQRLAALFGTATVPASQTATPQVATPQVAAPQVAAPQAAASQAAAPQAAVTPAAPEFERLSVAVRDLEEGLARLAARLDSLERAAATGSIGDPGPLRADHPSAVRPAVPLASDDASRSPITPEPQRTPEATPATPPTAGPAPASARAFSPAIWTPYGLDLGSAASFDELRELWAIARSQHGPVLEGLHALAAIRNAPPPAGFQIRLVAGPLANAVAAARLCAVLGTTGRACLPVPFEGQRLARN